MLIIKCHNVQCQLLLSHYILTTYKNVAILKARKLDSEEVLIYDYSGTSLLQTLWDQIFLATFCCNIEVFLFQVKNVLVTPFGTKILSLIMKFFLLSP